MGGGIRCQNTNALITFNVIVNNFADSQGGGISSQSCSPTLINNTIAGNYSGYYGSGLLIYSGTYTGFNNIIRFNNNGMGYEISGNCSFTYCNLYQSMPGLGNITTNPMFVDTANHDYHLLPTSPCINTGNPASPLDPDSTRADMGAYYFDQSGLTFVDVTLTPIDPPIIIPAIGGSFQFNATVANNGGNQTAVAAWIMQYTPGGVWQGPMLGPISLNLPAGQTVMRLRSQNVPGTAVPGEYLYRGYLGLYPSAKWDSSAFTYTKLGSGVLGTGSGDWSCTGEPFPGETREVRSQRSEAGITAISPNPFNPTTTISYQFSASDWVSLRVYDISGRLVATLADGWREAGVHAVTFNGSELSTGVYFVRVQAGDYSSVLKLVLIK